MNRFFVALAATLLMSSCSPTATTSSTAGASFTVNPLLDNDGEIQGCVRGLGRTGAPSTGDIFREDGVDTGARGFIRIDGQLLSLSLVSSNANEHGGTRSFADAAQTTQVVETLTTGEGHPESDSVDETGTLVVTHNGATQTIQVEGGTAC